MDKEPEFRGNRSDEMWVNQCQAKEIVRLKEDLDKSMKANKNLIRENISLRSQIKRLLMGGNVAGK